MLTRDSIDTLGLVVVKHTIEPNPKADCVGHFPTHVVETMHEIEDGETVGELLARLGLDEGDRIEIRFPTVAEDRAKLAAAIDRSLHVYDGPPPSVRRDATGAPIDPVRDYWPEAEAR
jgi:hypothetical protein